MNKKKEKRCAVIIAVVVCVCAVIALIVACTTTITFRYGRKTTYTLEQGEQALYCTDNAAYVRSGKNVYVYSKADGNFSKATSVTDSENATVSSTSGYVEMSYNLIKGSSLSISFALVNNNTNVKLLLLKGNAQYKRYIHDKHDDDDDDDDHHRKRRDDDDDDDDDDDEEVKNLCENKISSNTCNYVASADFDTYYVILEAETSKFSANLNVTRTLVVYDTTNMNADCGPKEKCFLNKKKLQSFCFIAEHTSQLRGTTSAGSVDIYRAYVIGHTFLIGIVIVVFVVICPVIGCVYLRERAGWGAKSQPIEDEEIEMGHRDNGANISSKNTTGDYSNDFSVSLLQEQVNIDAKVEEEEDERAKTGHNTHKAPSPPPSYDPYPLQ